MAKLCVAPRGIEVIEPGRISRLFAKNICYDTCEWGNAQLARRVWWIDPKLMIWPQPSICDFFKSICQKISLMRF